MIEIAEPGVHDGRALGALFDAYRCFYEREPDLDAACAFVAARLEEGDTRWFVATIAGVAVGFAHVVPVFDTLGMRGAWILEDLFVAPSHRRAGVGSALLAHVERFARTSGASRISLSTAHANETAQRLYLAHGYEHDVVFRSYVRSLD